MYQHIFLYIMRCMMVYFLFAQLPTIETSITLLLSLELNIYRALYVLNYYLPQPHICIEMLTYERTPLLYQQLGSKDKALVHLQSSS